MKRRKFLAGLTGASSLAAGVIGTGAFTSVSAKRQISVKVVDDDDAYLTLDPDSEFTRATTSGGTAEFYIPGLKTRAGVSGPDGKGIAGNSTYTFDNLLTVRNRGSDPIEVFSDAPGLPSEFERLALVDSDRQALLNTETNATEITSGGDFSAGILIETDDPRRVDHDLSLEIHADPISESSASSPNDPPGL